MLSSVVEDFKNSGEVYRATEIVDVYLEVRNRFITAWQTSLSEDGDGREALYRQLRGLDAAMDQLIAGLNK